MDDARRISEPFAVRGAGAGTLFAPAETAPPYRTTTARTRRLSREALAAKRLSRMQSRVLDFIRSRAGLGATDEQIAIALGLPGDRVRPRRVELERLGRIENTGVTRATSCGRQAVVWVATD